MASEYEVFKCFVRGLGPDTDENDLEKEFSSFGNVIDSKIIYDRDTGISRGFGFVTFYDVKSKKDAIMQMNGYEIDGCSISVEEAWPRKRNSSDLVRIFVGVIHARQRLGI
ncbi:unnamed protein product [Microthlaspi erraticum]|uniref:RRM domain-containing protein n=1 Tax=Microthlaspi erraticum TaxID=1685480 RepID=A0A6D2KAJ0_9BRAS|nr:unnamed protein product [Microthlaspi erraticum]